LAAVVLVAAFLAGAFLAAVVLVAAFLAGAFLAAVVLVAAFLAGAFSSAFTSSAFSAGSSAAVSTFSSTSSGASTDTFLVDELSEKTLGPLSPSSFCTKPCFLAESCPSRTASASRFRTNLIVLDESSLIGTKFVRFLGLLFVSTRP